MLLMYTVSSFQINNPCSASHLIISLFGERFLSSKIILRLGMGNANYFIEIP